MKQVCAKVIYRLRFLVLRRFHLFWISFVVTKARLRLCMHRLCSKFSVGILRSFFRHWSFLVSDLKRHQIEALLFSLENEFSRVRLIQDQFSVDRQVYDSTILQLEREVAYFRSKEQKACDEASQLASLNHKYSCALAELQAWMKEFEGFVVTDGAINRLRAHGLTLAQFPSHPVPSAFSSPPVNVRSFSAERRGRLHTSPDRRLNVSGLSDTFTPQPPSSTLRHSGARRRGGGYDLDV
jgi:hypothetical protein